MKPCPNCGRELPEEMDFCPFCMEKLLLETPVGGTPSHKRKPWWFLLLAIPVAATALAVMVMLTGLAVWLLWPDTRPKPMPSPSTTTSATQPEEPTGSDNSTPTGTESRSTTRTEDTHTTRTTEKSTSGTTQKTTGTKKGNSTTKAPCAAGHDWEALTQTVRHQEQGHYEQQQTGSTRVTIYKCAICYQKHDSLNAYYHHFDTQHAGTSLNINVFRDRYETDTEIRPVYEKIWVVDQKAYDETVIVGRRCRRCGKTEENK